MSHVAPLIAIVLLAGCAASLAPEAPPTPTPPQGEGGPRILADVSSAGCDYNDMVWLLPRSEVQALLPAGYTARDEGAGQGSIVINAIQCSDGFRWSAWTMFVPLETPTWPDVVESFDADNRTPRGDPSFYELDLYLLATHTDHPDLRLLAASVGMEWGPGTGGRTRTLGTGASMAAGALTHEGEVLASYEVAAAPFPVTQGAHHRQFFQNETGTLMVERLWTGAGGSATELALGAATCSLSAASLFHAVLGDADCTLGQDILNEPEWHGGAYFFPGVRPL